MKKKKYKEGSLVNNTGYTPGYKTEKNPINFIPSENITMENTPYPVYGFGLDAQGNKTGDETTMMPGQNYNFPGASFVGEIPMKEMQSGGIINIDGAYFSKKGNKITKEQFEKGKVLGMPYTDQGVEAHMNWVDGWAKPDEIDVAKVAATAFQNTPNAKANNYQTTQGVSRSMNGSMNTYKITPQMNRAVDSTDFVSKYRLENQIVTNQENQKMQMKKLGIKYPGTFEAGGTNPFIPQFQQGNQFGNTQAFNPFAPQLSNNRYEGMPGQGWAEGVKTDMNPTPTFGIGPVSQFDTTGFSLKNVDTPYESNINFKSNNETTPEENKEQSDEGKMAFQFNNPYGDVGLDASLMGLGSSIKSGDGLGIATFGANTLLKGAKDFMAGYGSENRKQQNMQNFYGDFRKNMTGEDRARYMQEGGELEQIEEQVVAALEQGATPEQIVEQLIASGIPEEQAVQMVQTILQEAQEVQQDPEMMEEMARGGMIRRKDGSYSKRGLWDNIRANRGSGKKPTRQMLEQERKIKSNSKQDGGEIEEYAEGGTIPERYRNMGFTKTGAKKKSSRPGKKWMVLAKKGDKYKVIHGGAAGMSDFKQHGSADRKKRFWDRMGGKSSAKAQDPFSPLYWHKKFGTWQEGGQIMSEGENPEQDQMEDQIVEALQQGVQPEQIMQQLIEMGMEEQDAIEMLQSIMQEMNEEPEIEEEEMKKGGMIKRKDGSYSKRGLWDNIRAKKGSGKKPTKEMLAQAKKIRANYQEGGEATTESQIGEALQQGVDPNQIIQKLVDMGMQQEEALEMVQVIMDEIGEEPEVMMQDGGTLSVEQVKEKTGEYIFPLNEREEEQANAEIEKGEYILDSKGVRKAMGETHEKGGTPVQLEEGTKVLSDHLKVGGDAAKQLSKDLDLKINATHTYAKVLDAYNKKSGLDETNKEIEGFIKLLGKQQKDVKDETTSNLNTEFLIGQIKKATDKKVPVEKEREKLFLDLFDMQEASKKSEDKNPIDYMENGGMIRDLMIKYNIPEDRLSDLLPKYQNAGPINPFMQDNRSKFTTKRPVQFQPLLQFQFQGAKQDFNTVPNSTKPLVTPPVTSPTVTNSNDTGTVNSTNNSFTIRPSGVEKLPYTNREQAGNRLWQGANYDKEWIPKVKNSMKDPKRAAEIDKWLTENSGEYSKNILYQLRGLTGQQRLDKIQQLATDYNPGPFHNAIDEAIRATEKPTDATPAKKIENPSTEVDPFGGKNSRTQDVRGSLNLPTRPINMPTWTPSLKVSTRLNEIDPALISPEQQIMENDRAVLAAQQGLQELSPAQRALANIGLAAQQISGNGKAIQEANRFNAQAQNSANAYNARVGDAEQQAENQNALNYEARTFTGLGAFENDYQNMLSQQFRDQTQNWKAIQMFNQQNALNPDVQFTGDGYKVYEPSLQELTQKYTDALKTATPEEKKAMIAEITATQTPAKKKYGGRYKNK